MEKFLINMVKIKDVRGLWFCINSLKNKSRTDGTQLPPDNWIEHYKQLYAVPNFEEDGFTYHSPLVLDNITDEKFTEQEVKIAIKRFKRGKAAGIDGLLPKFFKAIAESESLIDTIVKLFKKIKDCAEFPHKWRTGLIHNLYKGKGNTNDPKNYRGITLLSVFSKIFTKILCNRITQWTEIYNNIIYIKGWTSLL